ncbi:TIGR03773 family transporter-associated surface protein [Plantactinospora sp. KLBMP9567]|uniref:TIGR03773 family transporter-associated surface protein n=1 Tax=Plantactinospora sp. KLBMP9567 TaxID=3085900 RepID=UPI002981DBCE|nr:TIGR03773 family transporter-associated surface protein [Plantactinospora sp. KLBMP9567]MDW5329565.1 TIGR03773 family transporter-associated surface protein [Plantactinospora sp. KLBMP9567]
MRIRSLRAGAAGLAAAVLALVAGVVPARAAPVPVSADGADLMSVSLVDGTLSLRIRDATQIAQGVPGHDPADVVLGPEGGVAGRVPADSRFSFLGTPGQPVWLLATSGTAFPSFDTTGVNRGAVRGDRITASLRAADGPGRFTAYRLSGLGAVTPLFGTDIAGHVELPTATRTPAVLWAFDAVGDYTVTLAASAILPSGREVSTEATYRVTVPPITPGPPVAPPSVVGPADGAKALPQPMAEPPAARRGNPPALKAPAQAQPPKVAAATTGTRKVISDGHVDMGPQLTGDTWTIRLKDDTVSPAVWRELSDVVLHVKDKAKTTVPAGADFLGREGDTVWLLPQAQQSGIVWPGWNTQHESVVGAVRGNVLWTLRGVDGPGRFVLFLTGSFGSADVLFDSAESLPQRLSIPPNTHAHGNWGFSKPGLYRLEVQMSGTTNAGKAVTDTRTLTIAIGDSTDPDSGFGGGGSGDGSGNGSGNGNGGLPRTGESWVVPASFGGALLVAVGVLLVYLARRRRPTGPGHVQENGA